MCSGIIDYKYWHHHQYITAEQPCPSTWILQQRPFLSSPRQITTVLETTCCITADTKEFSKHIKSSHNRLLLNPHCFAWKPALPRFTESTIFTMPLLGDWMESFFLGGKDRQWAWGCIVRKTNPDLLNKLKSQQLKRVLSKSRYPENPVTIEKKHPQTECVPRDTRCWHDTTDGFSPKAHCGNQAFQESHHTQWWQREQKTSLNTGTYLKIRQTIFWKHTLLILPPTTAWASTSNSN